MALYEVKHLHLMTVSDFSTLVEVLKLDEGNYIAIRMGLILTGRNRENQVTEQRYRENVKQ